MTATVLAALGDWWNPVTWIQSAAGALHGAFDLANAVKNALGAALTILREVFRFFTDTGHFLSDAVSWLTNALFPPELQTWFLGTIADPGQRWDPNRVFETVFAVMQGPGIAAAAVASAARLIRACADHRTSAQQAVAEVLPRFLLTVLVIGIPGMNVSIGYTALVFAVNASVTVAAALFTVLLHASLLRDIDPRAGWFTQLFQAVSNAGRAEVAVAAGGIPLLGLSLYAVFLMVVRTVIIGFCVATAPLCVATLAFDGGNRFLRWWLDLFIGALLTPLVFAVAIALSVTLASSVVAAAAIGPLLAIVVMCGGLWFAGRMVHTITWRHFSHGGAIAGFAAGITTALGPVHRLANVGFMAEALGANAGGDNAAVNFMKRMGLASQGFNPASGVSSAMGALAGQGLLRAGTEPPVRPAAGVPDIGAMLSPSGRAAVAGVEPAFAQAAFTAFAHAHPRMIGSSTRDQPASTLPFPDRARLAWERFPVQSQRAFADDFLSLWLGSSAGPPAGATTPAPVPMHG